MADTDEPQPPPPVGATDSAGRSTARNPLPGEGDASNPWSTGGATGPESDAPAPDDLAGMVSVTTVPIRRLGSGGQADVMLVEHLGQLEAHKYLREGRGREREVFREALHTRRVSHAHIVKVFGIEKVGEVPVLRMEYVEGRDLGRVVDEDGVLPVEQLVPLAIQVCGALQATHEREIVHHDLKPSNLILRKDDRHVVVTDFGVSAGLRHEDGKLVAGKGGTPFFMAPELHESGGRGDVQSDIWSLGVTLYYLVSGIYPFPFGEKSPAEAVQSPPRDVTRSHAYVPPGFWHVLRRMLRADPDGVRYASMAEVQRDLEDLALSVTCGACGGTFRMESVLGACPEPSCQDQALASVVEARRQRTSAETSLADCEFDEARRGFEMAAKIASAAGDAEAAAELSAQAERVGEVRAEHDKLLAQARELFDGERDIDCIRRVHAARVRFSRSKPLRDLRLQVRGRFHELYKGTESRVMQAVRAQDFDAARATLTRVDQILGDPYARSELAHHMESGKSVDYQWLYQEVERKELAFNRYTQRALEKIAAFDFAKAQREYTRLETEFPSDEHVRMLGALRDAAAQYETVSSTTRETLQALLEAPADIQGNIRLAAISEAAQALLASFPVDRHPGFEAVREIGVLADQAAEAVRAAAREALQAADCAREGGQIVDEMSRLAAARELMLRTDLFPAHESEAIEARHRSLQSQNKKVDALYADAEHALKSREYAKAHAALVELGSLVPDGYRDAAGLRDEVDRLRGEVAALKEQLAKEFAEIDRGHFNLETATAAMRHAEKLWQLSDRVTQRGQIAELAGVAVKLVGSQRDFVGSEHDLAADAVPGFLDEAFVPVARALPEARWEAMCSASPELCRAICSLFDVAAARVVTGEEDVPRLLQSLERLLRVLREVRSIVSTLQPPAGIKHPTGRLAAPLVDLFPRASRADVEQHAGAATAFIDSLVELCPPSHHEGLQVARQTITRTHGQVTRARRMGRTLRVVAVGVPVLLLVVAAFWGGTLMGRSAERDDGTEPLVSNLGDLGLAPELIESVREWLSTGEGNARDVLLARWTEARDDLERARADGAGRDPARLRLADGLRGLAGALESEASSLPPELSEAMLSDLSAALTEAVRVEVARTSLVLDGRARPGPGVVDGLVVRLQDLEQALPEALAGPLMALGRDLDTAHRRAWSEVDVVQGGGLADARALGGAAGDMASETWGALQALRADVRALMQRDVRAAGLQIVLTSARGAAAGHVDGWVESTRAVLAVLGGLDPELPALADVRGDGLDAAVSAAVSSLSAP